MNVNQLLPHSYTFGSDPVPATKLIASISNDLRANVTTTSDHGYLTGYVVTIEVPPQYGMYIPHISTSITVTGTDTFIADFINTAGAAPFVPPSSPPPFTQAQVTPESGLTRNAIRTDGTF